jgi:hypothetical protein
MSHLSSVRFRFRTTESDEHSATLGHLLVRWIPAEQAAKLTHWYKPSGERDHSNGLTPRDAGLRFVGLLQSYVSEWQVQQQAAIDEHVSWSSARKPTTMVAKPGFRPVTARQQYYGYRRSIEASRGLIERDVIEALGELTAYGWWSSGSTPFTLPVFNWPDLWT